MSVYILKRIAAMMPTLLGVTIAVFLLLKLLPGTVVEQMLGSEGDEEAAEALRQFFGLDRPLHEQYLSWLKDIIVGDFGVSWRTGQEILPTLLEAFAVTGELAVFAVLVSAMIGIPLGLVAALRPYGILDHLLRIFSLAGVSVPVFFQGTVLIVLFSLFSPWKPPVGRDLLARVIWGSQASLGISVSAMLLALLVGSTAGLLSGYFGGYLDMVSGRIVDVLYSFPSQILGIFVAGILGPGIFNVILAIAIVFTPVFFRTMRSGVIKEKEREYVEAARSLGLGHRRIMFVHILRNSMIPVTVQFTVGLAVAIQLEAALGFLGLGVQPPAASWGSILNDGVKYIMTAPWISIMPGLFMVLAVFTFNLLGDGIRDWLDPHSEH